MASWKGSHNPILMGRSNDHHGPINHWNPECLSPTSWSNFLLPWISKKLELICRDPLKMEVPFCGGNQTRCFKKLHSRLLVVFPHPSEPGSKLVVLGTAIPPLIGNPYNGYINPYYWVDDHPLLYGNNGSLDPSTSEKYLSNWIISPNRDEHQKYLKPPPRCMVILRGIFHIKNAF